MLIPLINAVTPLGTLKTRLALFPLTVSRFAPGPVTVTLLFTTNSAVVSVIGLTTWAMSKVIVPPSQTSSNAWRSDPAPLSALVVTTAGLVQS